MARNTTVWIYSFAQNDSKVIDLLTAALTQASIQTQPLNPTLQGPGIVFFEETTDELYTFLSRTSRGSQEQILAIALSPFALKEGHAWRLLQAGAADVFCWQQSPQPAAQVAARLVRWTKVDQLLHSPLVQQNLIGESPVWRSLLRQIIEVAYFTEASVLIMGETGTGKELIARLIHTLDPRPKKQELMIMDCSTLVPELAGSEFFGHERGAFTGAAAAREGAFALANRGTLFLDEIGDLPLNLQLQLLRAIQERTYKKVGGNTWQSTHFRLVCATNKNLTQCLEQGEFRADLYYRIATWVCCLPPLRERKEDILPLVQHFLKELRPEEAPLELDEPVRHYLLQRDYPGNIRELKQVVARLSARHVGPGLITLGDIPDDDRPTEGLEPREWSDARLEQAIRQALAVGVGLKEIGRLATETAIRIALGEEGGNLQRAARRLGITDRALQMRQANQRLASISSISEQKLSLPQ
jgi:transcriptional regulator with GAF, ATPase, and Fis domain